MPFEEFLEPGGQLKDSVYLTKGLWLQVAPFNGGCFQVYPDIIVSIHGHRSPGIHECADLGNPVQALSDELRASKGFQMPKVFSGNWTMGPAGKVSEDLVKFQGLIKIF
jgi:hypothetical protein